MFFNIDFERIEEQGDQVCQGGEQITAGRGMGGKSEHNP